MLSVLNFFNTPQCLFLTVILSSAIKIFLIAILAPQLFRSPSTQKTCLLLIMVLAGSTSGELAWCIKLLNMLFIPQMPYQVVIFSVRIAWGFLVIQYQSLFFFVKCLTKKQPILSSFGKITLFISSGLFIAYLYLAIFNTELISAPERAHALLHVTDPTAPIEIHLMRYTIFYIFLFLIIPSLYSAFCIIRSKQLPKILHQQMTIIFKYLLMPYFVIELLIAFNFNGANHYYYAIVGTSSLLIIYIVYYCIRHIMLLRFLNFTSHVESKKPFHFIDDFKIILEQLSSATTVAELIQITNTFFKQPFGISHKKIKIGLQTCPYKNASAQSSFDPTIEEFLNHNPDVVSYFLNHKIAIYDELLFNNFYQEEPIQTRLITFLETIRAEIFLPIFEKERIIGFIIIESNARPNKLYSKTEYDQMLVFATYLGNVINLLQNRNLELLIHQEKELKEEIHKKEQEIGQYKESLRSFLKNNKQKEIGIIFYKNRRFIYSNQTAKEIIKCNVNIHEGHPISRALKEVAKKVFEYKSPQSMLVKDVDGTQLVICGVSNLEHNNVILTISHPDMADIITKQIEFLKDPTQWDYLLYLETTKSGQLINQLIPGTGETLLNFKISLLQTALSKKATLLDMPQADLMPMVELLHHINMRQTLYTLALSTNTNPLDITSKLFGINPIFGHYSGQRPLLEKLNGNGTLFIQNIEYLDLEAQEYLAEFIQYGYYRPFKSDNKINSSVRIICSTNQNLERCIQEGKFSATLFNELKKTCLALPSLQELPDQELTELAQGYTQQALKTSEFKNLLELSEKETVKLIKQRPISLQDLKTKVQKILLEKSKKNNIEQEIHFNPSYEITDPELMQASQLGKHALRDHKIMALLWQKFKNQNKIAAFLGVNRSSVNRRCKEYNLGT
jgi:hypothetical protein